MGGNLPNTRSAKPVNLLRLTKGSERSAEETYNSAMPRSIWNGVISFGMVSIPVSLYGATQEKDLRFNQIHRTCGSRIKQQKWCPVDKCEVPPDEIERGYEISKGHYAILTEQDFETLPVPTKHTITVSAFVKTEQIDPVFFDKSYYLDPTDAGVKPFALFLKALEQKGVAALGQIAIRSKEELCLLRASNGTVVLETLYYPDEIRKPEETKVDKVKVDDKELKMAESLIELLEEDFDPSKYHDQYREALLERIEAKQHGGELVEQPVAEVEPQVYNLMDALKASLEAAQKSKPKEKSG